MKIAHLVFAGLMVASGTAGNAVANSKAGKPAPRKMTPSALLDTSDGEAVRGFIRQVKTARLARVRAGARFFAKMAIHKDYSNEHVVMANREVTAFLDMTDPVHPNFDPDGEAYAELEALPMAKRAHILVVPNKPREHLTPSLGDRIGLGDLMATAKVVVEAEQLAKTLGIKNAKVFVNPSDDLSIGYLHVHIIGERDPNRAYPKLAQAPS